MSKISVSQFRKTSVAVAVALLLASLTYAGGTPAQATVAGQPTVVQKGTPIFTEDFENAQSTTQESILGYTPGVNYFDATNAPQSYNITYSADHDWLPAYSACNGWVLNKSASTRPGSDAGCGTNQTPTPWEQLQNLAQALGRAQEDAGLTNYADGSAITPTDNHVVAAYTNNSNTTGLQTAGVLFSTNNSTAIVPIVGHYYTVSAWYGATNCWANDTPAHRNRVDPKVTLRLGINGGMQDMVTGLNPCTQGTDMGNEVSALAGYYAMELKSLKAVQATSTDPLQIEVYNASASGIGNDGAFDRPQIIDVTPQLDKSFDPSPIGVGGVSKLKITITNTDDYAAKNGWDFTDTLPTNVVVANPPNIAIASNQNCGTTAVTATAGGSTVVVPTGQGQLTAGLPGYCEITVDVTSATPGTYTNAPDDGSAAGTPGRITGTGFNPPNAADLEVLGGGLSLVKSVTPTNNVTQGTVLTYTFVVTNTGHVTLNHLAIGETGTTPNPATTTGFTGTGGPPTVSCVKTTLAPNESTTCSGSYTVTAQDAAAGVIDNTAKATADDPTGAAVESNLSSAHVPENPNPKISLVKSVSPSTVTKAGDPVTYKFIVTNIGNVSVKNVTINEGASDSYTDATTPGFSGTGTPPVVTCVPDTTTVALLPGQFATCTGTYTASQYDVDMGIINNTATASATDVAGTAIPDSNADSAPVVATPVKALKVVKTASIASGKVGDPIVYTFVITNTGTTTMTGITLDESSFNGAGTAPDLAALTCTFSGETYTATTMKGIALLPVAGFPDAIITCKLPAYTAAPGDAGHTVANVTKVSGYPEDPLTGLAKSDTAPVWSGPSEADTVIAAVSNTGGAPAGVPGGLIGLSSVLLVAAAAVFAVRRRYLRK